MTGSDETRIALSKTKMLLLILASAAFIGIGAWMLTLDAAQIEAQRRFNNPLFIYGIAWAAIVFFTWTGVVGIRKMIDEKPGLIFNSDGITDNSSGVSAGLIPWSEISGFSVYQIQKQTMLVVLLKNPKIYIDRGSAFQRTLNRANAKMCGSPVSITSSSLKIDFAALQKLSHDYFIKYGNPA